MYPGCFQPVNNRQEDRELSESSAATEEFDVVVLGAGLAGLSCAIEAADLGGNVVVLEKMARPFGNIMFAGGVVCAAGTRFQAAQGFADDAEALYRDLMTASQQRADPQLVRAYAEKSAEAVHWLSDSVGVQWTPIEEGPPPVGSRGHKVKGPLTPAGAQLSQDLLAAATKRNIPLRYRVKTLELLANARREVTGLRARTEEGVKEYRARGGVVLATGGFHANSEMVREYMGEWASLMPLRGSNVSTGENITLTRPFGAKLVNMDQFHSGPIHWPTRANPSGVVNYGICVTPEGKRYVDESWTYLRIAKETARRIPDNQAFILLDGEAEKVPLVADRLERYRRAKAPIYEGEDIASLAMQAGISTEGLVETVKAYNDAVRTGRTSRLALPNTVKSPRPIDTPKFYAFPFQGGMSSTFGGLSINVRAQVLSEGDQPIAGLFAAGNDTGGLFYGDYIIGSQFGAAIVFGRIAAADACARASRWSPKITVEPQSAQRTQRRTREF